MKLKKSSHKLVLKKETIAALNRDIQERVKAGAEPLPNTGLTSFITFTCLLNGCTIMGECNTQNPCD
jgi:hypothetical protein